MMAQQEAREILDDWGYAVVKSDTINISLDADKLAKDEGLVQRVLGKLHQQTGITRMVFGTIDEPRAFRTLRVGGAG